MIGLTSLKRKEVVMSFAQLSMGKQSITQNGALGYGAMGLTAFYGAPSSDEKAAQILKAAYDAGCRHYDTAEIYKSGNPVADNPNDIYNETVIGKFLKNLSRDSFTVGTKFLPMKWQNKSDYNTVKTALTNSLNRLGLDYADIYYSHRVASLENAKEFAHSAKRLQEEGLIKHIGFSEIIGKWLKECYAITPIAAVQQEWSLITRSLEDELLPVCSTLGVTIVAYSPLGRNLLSGVITEPPNDWRASLPRYSPENLKKNNELVKEVEAIATRHNCTAAQLSLAWLFHKAKEKNVQVLPIPGTTKIENLLSNLGATQISITPEEMLILEKIGSKVSGNRADDGYMQSGIEGHLSKEH